MTRLTGRTVLYVSGILYLVLLIIGLADHGLWFDEAHAWCLVRDSRDLSEFAWNARNEGHPWGWFLLLWPLAHAGLPCWSMQVLQGAIAATVAGLILFRAPFPVGWRVLIVFGYFFVFEYAVQARNYALGVLVLLFAVDAYHKHGWNWHTAVWLILLSHVHFWCTAFTFAFLMASCITDRSWDRSRVLAMLTITASALLALWTAIPTDHLPYSPAWSSAGLGKGAERAFLVAAEALWPWSDRLAISPWGTQWLGQQGLMGQVVAGVLLLGIMFVLYGWKARVLYGGFILATLALPFFAPFAAVRYGGPLVIGLVAVLWLYPPDTTRRTAGIVLVPLFALQAACGLWMLLLHHERGFSQARNTAKWIQDNGYSELPVAVAHYSAGPPISAYVGKPVYYASRKAFGSFAIWYPPGPDPAHGELAGVLAPLEAERFVLLVRDEAVVDTLRSAGNNVKVLAAFRGGMIPAEDEVVLLVERSSAIAQ